MRAPALLLAAVVARLVGSDDTTPDAAQTCRRLAQQLGPAPADVESYYAKLGPSIPHLDAKKAEGVCDLIYVRDGRIIHREDMKKGKQWALDKALRSVVVELAARGLLDSSRATPISFAVGLRASGPKGKEAPYPRFASARSKKEKQRPGLRVPNPFFLEAREGERARDGGRLRWLEFLGTRRA